MRKTIAYILRQVGFKHINFAEDGETAWKVINHDPVDLVLLDWNMLRMVMPVSRFTWPASRPIQPIEPA